MAWTKVWGASQEGWRWRRERPNPTVWDRYIQHHPVVFIVLITLWEAHCSAELTLCLGSRLTHVPAIGGLIAW